MEKNGLGMCLKSLYILLIVPMAWLSGCGTTAVPNQAIEEGVASQAPLEDYDYRIAAGDELQIFVWRNPDLSNVVPVRPDGRISSPLVEDLQASGKTPKQLAVDIEGVLGQFIRDPMVTVTVREFVGGFDQQIRVVGEATAPSALPYRANMTLLDVMIIVGGLTEFAAGNKASILRTSDGRQRQIKVRIEDLIKGGDVSANVTMRPGDILIIPESLF